MGTTVLLNKYSASMNTIERIFYTIHTIVLALNARKQVIKH